MEGCASPRPFFRLGYPAPPREDRRVSSRNCAFLGLCLATVAAALVVAPLASLFAAEALKPVEPAVDFAREVQPLFAKRCLSCHGPDEAEGGLRLDEKESVFGELESGAKAIVAGNAKRSLLLAKISAEDPGERMPPEGKPLSKTEIDTIRRWIEEGAEWKSHWAFERPRPQSPPSVNNAAWVRNPIDAFILRKLEEQGLSPNPPADRIALIRRAYYDLTGLPPSPAEVDQFLADASPDAYERLIDRLLASPQYGERWARHWLDAVRYAETNSFERDGPKPNAWRYRDYVIRSFNDDKPYDQFIREQLAGDELPDVTHDTIIATGYYRLGLWDDEPADAKQARFDELDDIVSTTSQVFLALTVNCARCHDHKIDPIPQDDYYRLLAYFHEVRPYGIRSDQTSWNQTDIGDPAIAKVHAEADEQRKSIVEKMTAIENAVIARMPAEFQRLAEGSDREKVIRDKLKETATADEWQIYTSLRDEFRELRRRKLPPREMALSVKCLPEPPETFVLGRGNPHVIGKKVEPGVPKIFQAVDPQLPTRTEGAKSSGRRLALANWIASPENMLTARVMANRIWQFHFGRGIVRSSNNFGQLGDPPTHPELLDWLANEFAAGGWKIKTASQTDHAVERLSDVVECSAGGARKRPAESAFLAVRHAAIVGRRSPRYDPRSDRPDERRDVRAELLSGNFGRGACRTIDARRRLGRQQ